MDLATEDDMSAFLAHHGVKGMRWGQRKAIYNASAPVLKTLLDDPSPKNVDRPISPEHHPGHSGVTQEGSHFQTYHAGSKENGFSYTKFDTGEKTFFRSNSPKEMMSVISSNGRLLNSVSEMRAYGGGGKVKKVAKFIGNAALDHVDTMLLMQSDPVEDFLAHHGVKGQKWGVRKAVTAGANGAKATGRVIKKASSGALDGYFSSQPEAIIGRMAPGPKMQKRAIKDAKAAYTATKIAMQNPEIRTDAVKAAKVAFKVTKYGVVPLAAATGIAIPAVAGLGLSMKLINDPGVRSAVASAATYSRGVLKSVGPVHMSDIPKIPKVKMPNPHLNKIFSTTRTTKVHQISGTNSITLKDGSTVLSTVK